MFGFMTSRQDLCGGTLFHEKIGGYASVWAEELAVQPWCGLPPWRFWGWEDSACWKSI